MNIWEIAKELGFKEIDSYGCISGVFCTGKFDGLYDYNKGLLTVCINPYRIVKGKEFQGSLNISTIDDGVWTAMMKLPIDPSELSSELKNAFGHILPTESELNLFLRKYGMYGVCEG